MPFRPAILALILGAVAVPVAAQELPSAEALAYVRDQCTHPPRSAGDTRSQRIDLVMTPPERLLTRIDEPPAAWDQPGFLIYTWMMNRETGYTDIIPLSQVSASVERRRMDPISLTGTVVELSCADDTDCGVTLYTDGDVQPSDGTGLQCHNPERVIGALDGWIERNVSRADGAPPFVPWLSPETTSANAEDHAGLPRSGEARRRVAADSGPQSCQPTPRSSRPVRMIPSCLAAAAALALSVLILAPSAVAQESTPVPHGMDPEVAAAGRDFWANRVARRVNDWASPAFPHPDSVQVSRGRQQIGGVNGRRAYMSWSRQLTYLRSRHGACEGRGGDVFLRGRGRAEVTYRTRDESGTNSLYNDRTRQWVGFRSLTPLELTLTGISITVEVKRVVGVDFDRDYDVLDRYSRAFRSGISRLRPLTIRLNESDRTAYQRDPAAFEWGLYIGITDCGA